MNSFHCHLSVASYWQATLTNIVPLHVQAIVGVPQIADGILQRKQLLRDESTLPVGRAALRKLGIGGNILNDGMRISVRQRTRVI